MTRDKGGFFERFLQVVGKHPEEGVQLRDHAHFRIGGKADYFFSASSPAELVDTRAVAGECALPSFVIGGGTNLLFDDAGFRGLIVKNEAAGIRRRGNSRVEVLSGTPLSFLVRFCMRNGLGGLEFLAGIPGTVGGALFGNAGAFDREIGERLVRALILDGEGREREVSREYLSFAYRWSRLRSTGELLLTAEFDLDRGNPDRIRKAVEAILEKRRKKHPPRDTACAGSYFKNPVLPDGRRIPAASLLDQVGARGLQVGGAKVFEGHANFLINENNATAGDVLALAAELKKRVQDRFGVLLEEEVIFIPAEPSES